MAPCGGKFRVRRHDFFQCLLCLVVIGFVEAAQVGLTPTITFPSLNAICLAPPQLDLVAFGKLDTKRDYDLAGNFILQIENIDELPVVPFGP